MAMGADLLVPLGQRGVPAHKVSVMIEETGWPGRILRQVRMALAAIGLPVFRAMTGHAGVVGYEPARFTGALALCNVLMTGLAPALCGLEVRWVREDDPLLDRLGPRPRLLWVGVALAAVVPVVAFKTRVLPGQPRFLRGNLLVAGVARNPLLLDMEAVREADGVLPVNHGRAGQACPEYGHKPQTPLAIQ